MAITKIVENKGDLTTVSSNGRITLNQTTGELIIRNGSKKAVLIDESGFSYFDNNNIKRISIGPNATGQQQIIVYDASGKAIVMVGQDPKDSSPVIAVSEAGYDVIQELENE